MENKDSLVLISAKKIKSFSWCDRKLDTVIGKEIKWGYSLTMSIQLK